VSWSSEENEDEEEGSDLSHLEGREDIENRNVEIGMDMPLTRHRNKK